MKIIERLFGIINAIYFIGFVIFLLRYAGAILAFLGSSIGILIFLLPIIIGAIFSFRNLIKKNKGLSIFDKILNVFPIINFSLLLLFFILSVIN